MPITGPHLAVANESATLALCHTSAFSSAGPRTVYNLIFSQCNHEDMIKLETRAIESSFKPNSRSKVIFMRDEETGEIVSYAQWTLPVSGEGEKDLKDNNEEGKEEKKQLQLPDGVNLPLFKKIFLNTRPSAAEKEVEMPAAEDECWSLNRIGTKPEYQGRGAAKALMGWGTDQADRDGKYCVLWTDPEQAAFRIYEKAGFAVVGNTSEMELEPFSKDGVLKYVRMIRYPQKIE